MFFQKKTTKNLVVYLLVCTTLIFVPLLTIDIFNLYKFIIIILFASYLFYLPKKEVFQESKIIKAYKFVIVFFIITQISTFLFSNSSKWHQLIGNFGRNFGLLTYLSLAIISISLSRMHFTNIQWNVYIATIICISVNIFYGLLQFLKVDPLSKYVQNPYTSIVGTFGNPNFMSAFLGIASGMLMPYLFLDKKLRHEKIILILIIFLSLFLIYKSKSIQGLFVFLFSLFMLLIFANFNKKNYKLLVFWLILGCFLTFFIVAGMLQKGILTQLIYKNSITFRGDYWRAGIEMLKSYPIHGVGIDSYGDWYRAFRDVSASTRRGPEIVSNSAHNIFIDLGANSGLPGLAAYVFILVFTIVVFYKYVKKTKHVDVHIISIFIGWLGFLLQASISVNNIGLAIWGWVLPSLLVSEIADKGNQCYKLNSNASKIKLTIFRVVFPLLFIALAYFILRPEIEFKKALDSRNPNYIFVSAQELPLSDYRLLYASDIFSQNNLWSKSKYLLEKLLNDNDRSIDGWKLLYSAPNIDSNKKREILERMKVLDPHNPDLEKLG